MSKKSKKTSPPREHESRDERESLPEMDTVTRATLGFGWTAVAVFMIGGLALECLHLFKLPLYLEASLRRELWTLAHAHGTLLGVLTIALALTMRARGGARGRLVAASRALRASAVLMPGGFLLGGIGNAEGDPSLFIVLVPVGALLAVFAALVAARELRG